MPSVCWLLIQWMPVEPEHMAAAVRGEVLPRVLKFLGNMHLLEVPDLPAGTRLPSTEIANIYGTTNS